MAVRSTAFVSAVSDSPAHRAVRAREELRRMSVKDAREQASEIAADMETGYYIDANKEQWVAKPFVIGEMLRSMGYSPTKIEKARYPTWWPGTNAFRKLVDWKIVLRQFRDIDARRGGNPVGPLISMAVATMGERLCLDPESVPSRDIVDLISKLSRLYRVVAKDGEEEHPSLDDPSGEGTVVYEQIQRVIMRTPPGPARERLEARYRANVVAAQKAIPATVES
jgi:hypothetical protein